MYYRSGEYEKALKIINDGLSFDTYNTSLNYVAGIVYKAINNNLDGKEAFGWAARSMKYRSNAFSQMADIYLREKDYKNLHSFFWLFSLDLKSSKKIIQSVILNWIEENNNYLSLIHI